MSLEDIRASYVKIMATMERTIAECVKALAFASGGNIVHTLFPTPASAKAEWSNRKSTGKAGFAAAYLLGLGTLSMVQKTGTSALHTDSVANALQIARVLKAQCFEVADVMAAYNTAINNLGEVKTLTQKIEDTQGTTIHNTGVSLVTATTDIQRVIDAGVPLETVVLNLLPQLEEFADRLGYKVVSK